MRYIINCDKRLQMITSMIEPQKAGFLPSYVRLSGNVTEESARDFRKSLISAENIALSSGQTIIPILIDSYGGDAYALLSMIDAVNACSIPVATVVEGKAMSAGAILFTFGKEGHRYMGENASIMIHEVASGIGGKIEEIKSKTKHLDEMNEKIYKMVSKNIGKDKSFIMNEMRKRKNSDWYLDADECLSLNIANHIGIPKLETKISMNISFGL